MFNPILTQRRQVIRTFSNRESAGQALDHLVFSGFPIAQVFLLGHGLTEAQPQSFRLPSSSYGTVTGTGTGLKRGMILGNFVGGITGLLLGAGLLVLPGVGQLMVSSAITFTLLSGGVCTAAGGLMGALIGLGLTSEQAKAYSQQIAIGSVLLIVEGTGGDITRAEYMLKSVAS